MDNLLYEFSGHNKIAIPLIYHDNYNWKVRVYYDRLEINRSGRLRNGLQTHTTIYFSDASDVMYHSYMGYTWIIFSLPGINQSSSVFTTASVTKSVSVTLGPSSGEDVPFSNTYAICSYNDKNQSLKKHFDRVFKIFNEYRRNSFQSQGPAVVQSQESSLDKLKKLKELLDMGAITNEEYEEKRKILINQI